MKKTEKTAFVDDLKVRFGKANAAFVAHYRGMTVEKLFELRKRVRAGDGEVRVVKNRLARIAAKGSFAEGISDQFKGPVALVLSYKDPVPVAKAIIDSLADDSPLSVQVGSLGGKTIDAKGIAALSKLPDRQTLLGTLAGTLQAPTQNFVNVLAALPRGLANVLTAVKKQKEENA
jgi:large subunit ribosomal protein L10